jgi:hypothetical protein
MGPWVESGRLVGAALLIRLERPVWVSGDFRDLAARAALVFKYSIFMTGHPAFRGQA